MIAVRGADHRAARCDGGDCAPRAGSEALEAAAAGLRRRRAARSRRSSAAQPPTRRATWSSGSSARRSARRTSTRAPRRGPAARPAAALAAPELSAPRSPTSTTPTRSSSSAPTRCTRCRSSTCGSARRCAATAPGWRSRPSARPRSTAAPRRPPATRPARRPRSSPSWRRELGDGAAPDGPQAKPRTWRQCRRCGRIAGELRAGRDGGRSGASDIGRGRDGARPSTRCSSSPRRSTSAARTAAGCSRSRDGRTPAACARSAACPDAGPGFAETDAGRDAEQIRSGPRAGELEAVILVGRRPGPRLPRRSRGWARGAAPPRTVARDLDASRTPRPSAADVVFPAESLRREGGHRHPPRRPPPAPAPQRSRAPATSARTGRCSPSSRPRSATRPGVDSAPEALAALAAEVPFYAGITPRGDRRHGHSLAGPAAG